MVSITDGIGYWILSRHLKSGNTGVTAIAAIRHATYAPSADISAADSAAEARNWMRILFTFTPTRFKVQKTLMLRHSISMKIIILADVYHAVRKMGLVVVDRRKSLSVDKRFLPFSIRCFIIIPREVDGGNRSSRLVAQHIPKVRSQTLRILITTAYIFPSISACTLDYAAIFTAHRRTAV